MSPSPLSLIIIWEHEYRRHDEETTSSSLTAIWNQNSFVKNILCCQFQRVIQLTALEDTNVPDKQQWDNAIRFMESTLQREREKTLNELRVLIGPGWQERWTYWIYTPFNKSLVDRPFLKRSGSAR